MQAPTSLSSIAGMDIYLIDQILKGRFTAGQSLIDVGCGGGRNLNWFIEAGLALTASDIDPERELVVRTRFPEADLSWLTADNAELPLDNSSFDHVISNAVLHFAQDRTQFEQMWSELCRVLRPGGTLFIRTCSAIGLEPLLDYQRPGRYQLPDGSERYLIDQQQIDQLCQDYKLEYLEPVKSLRVGQLRVMTTLVLTKYKTN